ncbi:MAG: S-adenosylmethionine:tRNA ribosyltransferase-isomerase, partial [Bacteroidia bacterium]
MTHILRKSDFDFSLDEDRIAKYPLSGRDSSKLLLYKNEEITHHNFQSISELLDSDTLLVMNNAKVIPARLYFKRETGAQIEVLLLEPVKPSSYDESFSSTKSCSWRCIIGNSKKWKIGEYIGLIGDEELIKARLVNREDRIVELSWSNDKAFTDLLDDIGELPLP